MIRGYEADTIERHVLKKQLKVVGILLTHGHFDHITAADEVRRRFQTKIYASGKEEELLADPQKNVSVMMGDNVSLKADVWLDDGQELELLGETMPLYPDTGHTQVAECALFSECMHVVLRGYAVSGVRGRTDLSDRQYRALMQSVRERLLVLPEAVRVFPGHGAMTTIRDEKMFNPYAG